MEANLVSLKEIFGISVDIDAGFNTCSKLFLRITLWAGACTIDLGMS